MVTWTEEEIQKFKTMMKALQKDFDKYEPPVMSLAHLKRLVEINKEQLKQDQDESQ